MGRRCITTNGLGTADEPGVHGDGCAVVSEVGLVVLVDEVLVEQVHVPIRELFTVHLFDTLGEQTTVETNESLLGKFANKGCDVLVLYVGIGVEFRTFGCVGRLDIVHHKVQTTLGLTILRVSLAIKDESFGYLVVTFCHEGHFDLVLDLLDCLSVTHTKVREDSTQCLFRSKCTYR